MTGAVEVPGPGDPDGTAKGRVEIDVAAGEVCFKFSWEDIASPTMGHIHEAPAGDDGPVVVNLLDGISLDTLESDDDVRGCVDADPALLAEIIADPSEYYLNLHNARFPGGAVHRPLPHLIGTAAEDGATRFPARGVIRLPVSAQWCGSEVAGSCARVIDGTRGGTKCARATELLGQPDRRTRARGRRFLRATRS